MLEIDSVSRTRLQIAKRLRRFSASMIANRELSDAAVMEALENTAPTSDSDEQFYDALLLAIMEISSRSSQSISSIFLLGNSRVSTHVKFQSLGHESRAVMALYLIEEYSCADIAALLSLDPARVATIIEQSLEYLSPTERNDMLDVASRLA